MKFKVGDRVKIVSTSDYWCDNDIANPKNTEGTVIRWQRFHSTDDLPVQVAWDNKESNWYGEVDLEYTNTQTNTKMTTNQLMKNAALAVANKLLKANNTVTTLEIKVELRKTDPEFFWDQATVSRLMDEFAQAGTFVYTDNGTYRIYSNPLSTVSASQTAVGVSGSAGCSGTTGIPTRTTSTASAIVVNVPTKKTKTPRNTITRTKALELVQNSKGHFFKVVFTKVEDGSERTMNCQYVKGQTVSPLGVVKVKETSLQKKLKQTGDINTIPSKSVIRSFNINNLKVLGIGGKLYKVN